MGVIALSLTGRKRGGVQKKEKKQKNYWTSGRCSAPPLRTATCSSAPLRAFRQVQLLQHLPQEKHMDLKNKKQKSDRKQTKTVAFMHIMVFSYLEEKNSRFFIYL